MPIFNNYDKFIIILKNLILKIFRAFKMSNEFIFILQIISVTLMALGALSIGRCALVATITFQCVIANLFVTKQIMLFGLNVTCTDVFIVGAELSLNLLQEFFGTNDAKKAVRTSFFFLLCFLLFSQFQIWYKPSQFDTMHPYFCSILNFAPRIILASALAYVTSQSLSVLIFKLLKKAFRNKYLAIRSGLTSLTSQFADTIIFSFVALYGVIHSIPQIIFFSFLIKIITIAMATPFIIFAKTIFKKTSNHEQ